MNKLIPRLAPAGRPTAALAGLATMAAGLAMAAPAGAASAHVLPVGGHAVENSTTIVYTPTAAEQTFAVPAGVTSINVIAIGAAGGAGAAQTGAGGAGGAGEQVSGTLAVTPLSTLFVEVGGVGTAGSGTTAGIGGFNGGAAGGGTRTAGGGGGGASDIRTISNLGGGTLSSRLIVAAGGGGGGGGGDCLLGVGGAGGSSTTTAGTGVACTAGGGGAGGAIGTGSAGGLGGTGGTAGGGGTIGTTGAAGVLGSGGIGEPAGSGGAGGGLFGGGGGGGAGVSTVPDWGGGGGGGAGSSFGTDLGPTASTAEVSITYTAPGPPPPVGSSDLKVFLKHQGVFQHHRLGSYGVWVTNTGTAATTVSHPMVVNLGTQRGIKMVQGGKGTGWQCQKANNSTQCTRSAPLGAGRRTMITVTVWVNARAGKTRFATATVSPSDKTPADNISTDKAIIRKH
jgi:hypothetical protein